MAEKEHIEREALLKSILELPPKMDEQGYGWLKWIVIPVMCFDVTCLTIAAFIECRDIWKKK